MVPKSTFKTLFMGLENSGKTSIVYSLRKNANLLDLLRNAIKILKELR